MKKLITFFVLFLGLFLNTNAQETTIFYQSSSTVATSKDNAKFYVVYKPLAKNLVAYKKFTIDNVLQESGQVQSIVTQIKEGTINVYYANGNIKDVLNYQTGLPNGLQTHYFNTGKINYTIMQTSAGYGKRNTATSSTKYFYCAKPNGEVLLNNGDGSFEAYGNNQQIVKQGSVKNSMPDGLWKGYDNEKVVFLEEYNNGFLIKGEKLDAIGNKITYTNLDTRPEPKGGINEFYSYISTSIQDLAMLKDINLQGNLTLHFIVEASGAIKEIKIAKPSVDLKLNTLALEVLKQAPKWKPATMQGEAVDMGFYIPISFE